MNKKLFTYKKSGVNIDQADKFLDKENPILDPNIQVEDQFFVSALLGRAYKYTKNEKYEDFISNHILNSPLHRDDGIYIHSKMVQLHLNKLMLLLKMQQPFTFQVHPFKVII